MSPDLEKKCREKKLAWEWATSDMACKTFSLFIRRTSYTWLFCCHIALESHYVMLAVFFSESVNDDTVLLHWALAHKFILSENDKNERKRPKRWNNVKVVTRKMCAWKLWQLYANTSEHGLAHGIYGLAWHTDVLTSVISSWYLLSIYFVHETHNLCVFVQQNSTKHYIRLHFSSFDCVYVCWCDLRLKFVRIFAI